MDETEKVMKEEIVTLGECEKDEMGGYLFIN